MSKFDDTFFSILQQHPNEVEFLNTVFQFLQRRTPCFNGPKADENFTVLINTLTHQRQLFRKAAQEEGGGGGGAASAPAPAPAPAPAKPKPAAAPAAPKKTEAEEIAEKIAQAKAAEAQAAADKAAAKAAAEKQAAEAEATTQVEPMETEGGGEGDASAAADNKKEEEEEDKGLKPVGNGGTTEHFVWTQTLQEVTITVPLPAGTRGNMLSVEMKQQRLKFGFKGKAPIREGELTNRIKVEDSVWVIEGGLLVFTLSKLNQMEWWKCIFVGDPEIDTSKVEPENSQLGDLDGDTRQVVEKMMFDQRQKAMGLPTSEEKKKQDMLQQFMKSHPEMDFSNCKFN